MKPVYRYRAMTRRDWLRMGGRRYRPSRACTQADMGYYAHALLDGTIVELVSVDLIAYPERGEVKVLVNTGEGPACDAAAIRLLRQYWPWEAMIASMVVTFDALSDESAMIGAELEP